MELSLLWYKTYNLCIQGTFEKFLESVFYEKYGFKFFVPN